MSTLFFVTIVLLTSTVTAIASRFCTNVTVPVTISSRNGVFNNIATPVDNLEATLFALNATRQGMNGTAAALTGYATVSGTYNISAKYCSPPGSHNESSAKLQILTHGIGFDKTYWDLSYNAYNYSYIRNALTSGYHTLSYDRLGIGNSSHGDPKNEIQSFLEVQALAAITSKLRNGTFPSISANFSKIIHVGHSFGSAQTFALTAMYPNISDGIVLTGFSTNSSFMPIFLAGNALQQAYLNQPLRFGNMSAVLTANQFTQTFGGFSDLLAPIDLTTIKPLNYPPGYLTNADAGSTNFLFLYNGNFDPKILYVGEKAKQPVTVGELLTVGSVPTTSGFSGPVLVFTGDYDVPFCGGNCTATGSPGVANIPSQAKKAFPSAKPFAAYVQPKTGHGLQLHYNATAGNMYINEWLFSNGL